MLALAIGTGSALLFFVLTGRGFEPWRLLSNTPEPEPIVVGTSPAPATPSPSAPTPAEPERPEPAEPASTPRAPERSPAPGTPSSAAPRPSRPVPPTPAPPEAAAPNPVPPPVTASPLPPVPGAGGAAPLPSLPTPALPPQLPWSLPTAAGACERCLAALQGSGNYIVVTAVAENLLCEDRAKREQCERQIGEVAPALAERAARAGDCPAAVATAAAAMNARVAPESFRVLDSLCLR
jgi:hypothetical protein